MFPSVLPNWTPVFIPPNAAPIWVKVARVSVQAGFPSQAEDHAVDQLELMNQLVRHPQATYLIRIAGDSMREVGILNRSVVLVDKAIRPRHDQIVIAVVDGEFTCKRLYHHGHNVRLKPENPAYPDIVPKDCQSLEVWGVVVAAINQYPT